MQDFQLSNKFIINKSDLSHQSINKYLDDIKNKSVDYADIYFQYSKNEFWSLEDGVVKNGSYSIDQGVVCDQFQVKKRLSPTLMIFQILH